MKLNFTIVYLAFLLSLGLCAFEIPLLKRLKAGQNILSYVKEHASKAGTPSMGGLGFILAASLIALLLGQGDRPFFVVLSVGLGYLLVGFLDDFLKCKRRENLGLRPYQKIFFQLLVALFVSLYCCLNGLTVLRLPFSDRSIGIGYWALPLGILVCLATVNSVNLTDGLDGLAGSSSGVYFLLFGILTSLEGENPSISRLCFSLFGGIAAFLVFNVNRASVFMGDTGSLSLGGFAAASALVTGNALFVPVMGIVFVFSSISVIVQVIYYKKTGKRVFRMAPVHHHFQMKGYSESKIAYVYALITAFFGGLLLFPFI